MAPPMLRVVRDAILNVMSERDDVLAVLRTVLPELRRDWPIRSLALFGSVARGEAAPESDLDILVEFEAPIGLSDFLALEDKLSALTYRRGGPVSPRAAKPFHGRPVLRHGVP